MRNNINLKSKVRLYYVIVFLLITKFMHAQCNWEDLPTIQIHSKTELEEYGTTILDRDSIYMNISIIEQPSLEDPINNLNPLANIKYLEGALCITQTEELENLDGLQELNKITGPLVISSNNGLTTLDGISNLSYIGDDLFIAINDKLISTEGTFNIDTIGGEFRLSSSPRIKEIKGLNSIKFLGGIDFFQCDSLTEFKTHLNQINSLNNLCINETPIQNLDFLINQINIDETITLVRTRINQLTRFNNLEELTGRIRIEENALLTNFDAFQNLNKVSDLIFGSANFAATISENSFSSLDSIMDDCIIRRFPLADFNVIKELDFIGGRCLIKNLELVKDLDGFENFSTTPSILTIEKNENMIDCSSICDRIQQGLATELSENPGCNSVNDLIAICGPSSIDDSKNSKVVIYPNPAYDKLVIKEYEYFEYRIVNLKGKNILKGFSSGEIDISSLSTDLYYIELIDQRRKRMIQKFYKQ